ncbi:MAG: xanthine dehydrogenase molybdopterin binding subunit [Bacteroidota bacterium]
MNSVPHDSAIKHVSGQSIYIDDMHINSQLLHGKVVYSKHAHAKITSIDISEAKKLKGVHAVLTYKDIPGENQMGPVVHDEPCLAENEVICVGQAIVLIAADSEEIAREAEKLIQISYEPLEAILDLRTAIEKNALLGPPRTMQRGDVVAGMKNSKNIIKGELETGAQEHWYLETHICLAVPGEGNEITAYSSTQHPSETQAIISEVLGRPKNEIVVEIRRMGGAFGGKETQANWLAAWSSLLANATKRPVKLRLFRDDDQIMTGKRHPYLIQYEVGFDDSGKISALNVTQNADGGCVTDLSFAILERAMLHADNCYYIPDILVTGKAYKTNLPSNTAYRGFGGPQGIAGIESIIDKIARYLKKDAAEIRKINFYGIDSENVTHYGQEVELNRIHLIYEQLMQSSNYKNRRLAVNEFNSKNEFFKRGLAMTPVKFGISFTTTFLNQAGSLVHVYTDGTVLVNHGGTEMGQGLNTKITQIAALEFGIDFSKIKVNATNTSKVANTSATAASAGTDLNGMAVKVAVDSIKKNLSEFVASHFNLENKASTGSASVKSTGSASDIITKKEDIIFENNEIIDSKNTTRRIAFSKAAQLGYLNQIHLSANGFYKTPDIGWDKATGWGKPFNYYAYGMCVSEVEVDTLTGFYKNLRTDILHDCGDSINPGLDIGQVEGAYMQGVGWCTTEECKRNDKGELLNHSPDTYKIPSVQDIPIDFRTSLLQNVPNPKAIRKSKAVAEPPFMHGLATWLAIKDAVSAVKNHEIEPEFRIPATNEVILLSIEKLRKMT